MMVMLTVMVSRRMFRVSQATQTASGKNPEEASAGGKMVCEALSLWIGMAIVRLHRRRPRAGWGKDMAGEAREEWMMI